MSTVYIVFWTEANSKRVGEDVWDRNRYTLEPPVFSTLEYAEHYYRKLLKDHLINFCQDIEFMEQTFPKFCDEEGRFPSRDNMPKFNSFNIDQLAQLVSDINGYNDAPHVEAYIKEVTVDERKKQKKKRNKH